MSIIDSQEFMVLNNLTIVVTQATVFSSPVRTGIYLVNEQLPILLTSPVTTSSPFNVTQNCNGTLTSFSNVLLGVATQSSFPSNYIGMCVYSSPAVGFYRAASVQINVLQGTVSFAAPANNSVIPAGRNTILKLVASKAANFTVQLSCPTSSATPVTSTVLSGVSVNFFVPKNFSTNTCVFDVINPSSSYTAGNPLSVRVIA